jgi:hypothetical protein
LQGLPPPLGGGGGARSAKIQLVAVQTNAYIGGVGGGDPSFALEIASGQVIV